MSDHTLTLPEIRREGLQALLDRLGPASALRFLQQYDPGHGDYTSERRGWIDAATIESMVAGAKNRRPDSTDK